MLGATAGKPSKGRAGLCPTPAPAAPTPAPAAAVWTPKKAAAAVARPPAMAVRRDRRSSASSDMDGGRGVSAFTGGSNPGARTAMRSGRVPR
ncbi:hypothetical protein [Promicromonospora soli]